jgi:hypothetical protein
MDKKSNVKNIPIKDGHEFNNVKKINWACTEYDNTWIYYECLSVNLM